MRSLVLAALVGALVLAATSAAPSALSKISQQPSASPGLPTTLHWTAPKANSPDATFVVNSNLDTADNNPGDGSCVAAIGVCTLRAAIQEANAFAGPDTIDFAIGFGTATIAPGSALPALSDTITIDGTTQPGYRGLPIVELSGTSAGAAVDGLTLNTNGIVRGLVINRFTGKGIVLHSNDTLENSFIGTDVTGMLDRGNVGAGIELVGEDTTIGGPARGGPLAGPGNLISGNNGGGISVPNVPNSSSGNTVQGNLIGTNLTASVKLGNTGAGIASAASGPGNHFVGNIGVPGAGNVIAGNSGDGISLTNAAVANIDGNFIGTDPTGTVVLSNTGSGISIANNAAGDAGHSAPNTIYFNTGAGIKATTSTTLNYLANNDVFFNGGLGIDLGTTGVTPNDSGDGDTGTNNLQNFPALSTPTLSADGRSVSFTVKLNSNPNTTFELDYYTSPSCDGSGNGEGAHRVGTTASTVTDSSGNLTITKSIFADPGEFVTATASRRAGTSPNTFFTGTSEFSACLAVPFAHTFTVNSNGDAADAAPGNGKCFTAGGVCTLRAAIQETNQLAGLDLIKFAIGSGLQTIQPTLALQSVTQPLTIDGSTQPGFAGVPLIELDGTKAGASADGLNIAASSVTVKNLAINRFSRDGIRIVSGSFAKIQGNSIGTDPGGSTAKPNGGNGITISGATRALIGGATNGTFGNVISGNAGNGILISGLLIDVQRNMIGTNRPGTADLGNGADGVKVSSPNGADVGGDAATFRNVISGNSANGVEIVGTGSAGFANDVRGNLIGVGSNGSTKIANSQSGVFVGPGAVDTNIGGTQLGGRNVISGNGRDGVAVIGFSTTTTRVRGNLIGTDLTGAADAGNTGAGVSVSGAPGVIIGAAPPLQRNVISGNGGHGVLISGSSASGAKILGNIVGLKASGTGALPNDGDGLFLQSTGAVVGGTPVGAENVIAANRGAGITLATTAASGASLLGNLIGVDVNSTAAGNLDGGIAIAGAPNVAVGGGDPGAGNVVSGNAADGIAVTGASASGVSIKGNLVGTSGSALTAVPNVGPGLRITTASAKVGGGLAGEGNVISGNLGDGVLLSGAAATGNSLEGNLIGVTAGAGLSHGNLRPLGNSGDGVLVSGAPNNTIGSLLGQNIIGGNARHGVELAGSGATGNTVAGDGIGSDGIADLGNGLDGVLVTAPDNTIGSIAGSTFISGNTRNGIELSVANGNTVTNSHVGVDGNGSSAIANGLDGILVDRSANTTIGNPIAPPNIVGGNLSDGIVLTGAATTGTEIVNNIIGDAVGGLGSPNNGNGIAIASSSSQNLIGGLPTQLGPQGNVIRANGGRGVFIGSTTSVRNTIQGNSIDANGGLGIDLGPLGVTPNDDKDPDGGANNQQNFPVLTSAVTGGGFVSLNGTLNSAPNTVFTIDVYASPTCDPSTNGEGATFVGSATLPATGSGGNRPFPVLDIPATVAPNQAITLTATDPNGNTSEFSKCVVAPEANADVSASLADSPDPVAHGSNLTYTVTVTNAGPNRALGTALTQTLGQRLTLVSATPSVGTCEPSGSRVICDLGTLAPGQSATVSIVATVSASFTGTITNTATATSGVTDPNQANNASTQATVVN